MLRLILILVACSGGYVFYGLVTRPASRTPARMWLGVALLLAGSNAMVWDSYNTITRLTGVPNLARLIGHLVGGIAAACAMHCMMAYWAYPPEQAERAARRQQIISGAIALTMIVLFAASVDQTVQERGEWQDRYAHIPQIAAYTVAFNTALGWMLVELARSSWTYASRIHNRRRIRTSLRLFAAAAVIGLIYCVTHIANTIGTAIGTPLPQQLFDVAVRAGQYLCLLLIAAAAVIPGVGATIIRSRRAIITVRLRPLYQVIRDALPCLAVRSRPLPNGAVAAIRGFLAGDDAPVHGMVVDIRDGYLELRPWLDEQVIRDARHHGHLAALNGTTLEATVEAATIACAARDRREGLPPAGTGTVDPGAADMAGEIRWLGRVSRATRSQVVQVVLDRTVPAPSWADQQLDAIGLSRDRQ